MFLYWALVTFAYFSQRKAHFIGIDATKLDTNPAVPMSHNANDVRNAHRDAMRFTSHMNKGLYICVPIAGF